MTSVANEHDDLREQLDDPRIELSNVESSYLEPPDLLHRGLHFGLYGVNWFITQLLFRVRTLGAERLPDHGPVIFTPNHTSSLDPPTLAAALPYRLLKRTCWIARRGVALRSPLHRAVSRATRTVPVNRDNSALLAAAAAIQQGENLIWFPEGSRSVTGELQPFHSGIGTLLAHFRIPATPIRIEGAHELMPPPSRTLRKLGPIQVHIGEPYLAPSGSTLDDAQQIADALRQQVDALARGSNTLSGSQAV